MCASEIERCRLEEAVFFFISCVNRRSNFNTQRSLLRVITRLKHTPNITTPSWWLRIVAANLGRQSKLKYYRPEKADLFYSSRVRSPGYFHCEEALSYRTAREFLVRLASLREAVSCHSGFCIIAQSTSRVPEVGFQPSQFQFSEVFVESQLP